MSFTVKFDLDSESATFQKFVLTNTTTYVDATLAKGYWKVEGPMGVVHLGTIGSPDFDGSDPDWVLDTVLIPTINNVPEYLFGTYTFTMYTSYDGGAETAEVVTYVLTTPGEDVITTDGAIATGCLTYVIDCFRTNIKLTDETEYGDYSSLSRTMTLHPPSIVAEADTTSSGPVLLYTFSAVNAGYEFHLNTLATYVTGSVTLSVRVLNDQYVIVKCSKLSAQLLKCFIRYVEWFKTMQCERGGIAFIEATYIAEFLQVSGYINAYNAALQIGSWTTVETYHDKIEDLIGKRIACDCGCDSDKPTIITPYTEIVSGASYIFAAGPGLSVSTSGTDPITVTYKIADSFYAFLAALYEDYLSSTDSSVQISSSVAGTIKTWDIKVKNSCGFNFSAIYSAGNDLSVTISGRTRQGTRYVDVENASVFGTPNVQLNGFPHASLAALNSELCVFKIQGFLAAPTGSDFTDKIDVDVTELIYAGAAEGDFSQPLKYVARVVSKLPNTFYIQLFNAIDGLPINMATFIINISSISFTIKINQ